MRGILFRMKTEESGAITSVFQIGIMSANLNRMVNKTVFVNLHRLKGVWGRAVDFYSGYKKISKKSAVFKSWSDCGQPAYCWKC